MWKNKLVSIGNAPNRLGLISMVQEPEEKEIEGKTHCLINAFVWLTNFNARGPPQQL